MLQVVLESSNDQGRANGNGEQRGKIPSGNAIGSNSNAHRVNGGIVSRRDTWTARRTSLNRLHARALWGTAAVYVQDMAVYALISCICI
jgi:hypothetical protein